MKSPGEIAVSKDSAQFIRLLITPHEKTNDMLTTVNDFFINGKQKLMAQTFKQSVYEVENGWNGSYIEYFDTGKRKCIKTYKSGKLIGESVIYYPNGKLYNEIIYKDTVAYLKECRDTTGNVLAENGNGKWIKLDSKYSYIANGPVVDGREDGEWKTINSGGKEETGIYKNGILISGDTNAFVNMDNIFITVDTPPAFIGGELAFYKFLAKNVKYPTKARENRIQGRVIIQFVVEKDGTLTNFKVIRKMGYGGEEEALRVLKLSPPWKPGMQNGAPVRVQYSVPISFSTSDSN
ncbi:energy transducer TonB [Mucilaginibacter segetis]|uniref:TonB family protein n=1 Tax=Mucilaginibacter segetis TaxID=2793071 RepID=A0A934UML8_9SPHI|nr:energy transducer TonB [Mucilaginibacter segetis]MBK0379027.1 TonB family protein [Mucilaginibacter segetis]